jgi:molybdopterin-containing oxidoreductase family iron-sulfur binding subunit
MVGPRQPAAVHALAHVLNRALGNVGATLTLLEDPDPERAGHLEALSELAGRLRSGTVETLLILGSNPVLTAPADLGFGTLVEGVATSIHLGLYRDETGRRCTWHLPEAHGLEAWGDGTAWDGTHTLAQPLIAPLHGGRSAVEVVAGLLDGPPVSGHDLVRAELLARYQPLDPEAAWRKALHDGLVAGTSWAEVQAEPDPSSVERIVDGLTALAARPEPGPERLELVFAGDAKVHDGRFANNAWLQELPEPLTKITWGNALLVAPPTARQLGLEDGEVVAVEAGSASVELPLYVVPGAAPFCLQATLGYGRSAAGRVGDGVGVDVYPLRTAVSPHSAAVTVRPTGRRERLATTQDHHAIDILGFEARNTRIATLVREATLAELQHEPEVIQHQGHHLPLTQLWQAHAYEGEQWGMAVDLNACTGCNACVVACQAENNIPVVGREQVGRQREMQWIRVDRYFRTPEGQRPEEVDAAEVVFQPVACVHCENAPCEQVCPVAATQHTRDGLNAMAYNRCVGTRYCSNNCPYKVRRFNFFNYREHLDQLEALQLNPEVTVRSRGVMEKCTYCVQRIEAVRIRARNERRPIADGEVVPACAQTCPTRAITFGNLNDPSSAISRLRDDHRAYAMLAELNVRPRTVYLARLRNPVPDHGKESS